MPDRDPELTKAGHEQAHLTGEAIRTNAPVDFIFTSPFVRCVETAAGIAAAHGGTPAILVEHGLCEWLCTKWFPTAPSLLSAAELRKMAPTIDESYTSLEQPTHGEPQSAMIARYVRTFRAIVAHAASRGANIAIVTHGYGIYAIQDHVSDIMEVPEPHYCCLTRIIQDGTDAMVVDERLLCDISHWKDKQGQS